jgi:hypothetical protein
MTEVLVRATVAATWVSQGYAARVHKGEAMPHPRYSAILATMMAPT